MKHLIAFLGYSQSRIQHPVYRQFVQAPLARRNATLLFQSRPLDERELVHEINELRRREGKHCELTFHICATLNDTAIGQQIAQTVVMIHRLYDCPSYVYCLMPDPTNCSYEERNTAWKCLSQINNCVNDYPHLRLISQCFLYHDKTQQSLAKFLFQLTSEEDTYNEIERYGYMGKLVTRRKEGDISYQPEFPSIFATFNASGIQYPEEEVRYYLHQCYLQSLLEISRPESNPIDMEVCNEHVEALLHCIPLSTEQLTLLSEDFIELPNAERHHSWQQANQFWEQSLQNALKDLDDRPHDEWLNLLHQMMEVNYQTRYREMGVEYFYKQQKKLTPNYRAIMHEQIRTELFKIIARNPYPPETSVDIVHSLVNRLQQISMGIDKQHTELTEEIKALSEKLAIITKEWEVMGFFDRMRGKDKLLLDEYKKHLVDFYVKRTSQLGTEFACKLLNELIPQVIALSDAENHIGNLCQGALDMINGYLSNNTPTQFIPIEFDAKIMQDAADAIRSDKQQLLHDFELLLDLLYGSKRNSTQNDLDSEMLLIQLRDSLDGLIDAYIQNRIEEGTMPAVLRVNIIDRLKNTFQDKGGMKALVERLKNETALSLKVKGEGRHNEQYLLISPVCDGLGYSYLPCTDTSSVQMLHILTGIKLPDLDGFAGQRMFVEPSMF